MIMIICIVTDQKYTEIYIKKVKISSFSTSYNNETSQKTMKYCLHIKASVNNNYIILYVAI